MEIIHIEASTFNAMMQRFDEVTGRIIKLCDSKGGRRLDKWLDGNDVCTILSISKRTLQTYRDNGVLSFSRIEKQIYYRPQDVERLLKENCIKIK